MLRMEGAAGRQKQQELVGRKLTSPSTHHQTLPPASFFHIYQLLFRTASPVLQHPRSDLFLVPGPAGSSVTMNGAGDPERNQAIEDYKKTLLDLREWEAKLKSLRMEIKDSQKEYDITEENIKALQSVGQIIGEVLKQLDEERCKHLLAPSAIHSF